MILIVDDDPGMVETCSMLLETQAFEVSVAASALEALAILKHSTPALVITDFLMPEMTGVELSERLRADPATAGIPILLMSASPRCEIPVSSNYDVFLRKPFSAETLLAEVRKLLDGRSGVSEHLTKA